MHLLTEVGRDFAADPVLNFARIAYKYAFISDLTCRTHDEKLHHRNCSNNDHTG